MKRRAIIGWVVGGSAVAVTGALFAVSRPRTHPHLALQTAIDRIRALDPANADCEGPWPVARTLHHLAQSIEFSMVGYPELRSAMFRRTVGRTAYNVFQSRGSMGHDTAAIIPGETIEQGDPAEAKERLVQSLVDFQNLDTAPKPHFAYGELSHAEYAKAHVMHLHDHIPALAT